MNSPIMFKDSTGFYPKPLRVLGDMISGLCESMGNLIWPHALKYLELTSKEKLKLAKKIINKNGLRKSAINVVDDYTDDAIANLKFGKGMTKFGKILGTALTVYDIGSAIYNNYTSGSETWISESIVDVGYIAIQNGISAVCIVCIPGVGWIVAIGANLLLDYIVEETGDIDSAKSWASQYDDEIRGFLFGKGLSFGG